MYATSFDMDTSVPKSAYRNGSCQNACNNIRKKLDAPALKGQQGSMYFGDETVDAVQCVLPVQAPSARLKWFRSAVHDIQVLPLEEDIDLISAVKRAFPGGN